MEIEQTLQNVKAEIRLTINAPNEWGKEVMKDDPQFGEIYRDYFELERHIKEMINEGYVEVECVEDIQPSSEKENVTLLITDADVQRALSA